MTMSSLRRTCSRRARTGTHEGGYSEYPRRHHSSYARRPTHRPEYAGAGRVKRPGRRKQHAGAMVVYVLHSYRIEVYVLKILFDNIEKDRNTSGLRGPLRDADDDGQQRHYGYLRIDLGIICNAHESTHDMRIARTEEHAVRRSTISRSKFSHNQHCDDDAGGRERSPPSPSICPPSSAAGE